MIAPFSLSCYNKTMHELTESLEDYLETILQLQEEHKVARVKDIAAHLNVKMPSVTNALKILKSKGLIDYERNSFITLTSEGESLALKIIHKHEVCKDFFLRVFNLPLNDADRLACSVEHHITENTMNKWEKLNHLIHDFCEKDKDFLSKMSEIRKL